MSALFPEHAELNADDHWVTGIPQPREAGIRIRCAGCRRKFWNQRTYRGHYALAHILKLPETVRPGSGDPERGRMTDSGLLPEVPGQTRGRTT